MWRRDNMSDRTSKYLAEVLEELELPSGHTFTLQEPDIVALGHYMAAIGIEVGSEYDPEDLSKATMLEHIAAALEFLVPAACVNPRVSMNRDPGTIHVSQLKKEDQIILVGWCMKKLRMDEEGITERRFLEFLGDGSPSG